jgi:hypothetical protein
MHRAGPANELRADKSLFFSERTQKNIVDLRRIAKYARYFRASSFLHGEKSSVI